MVLVLIRVWLGLVSAQGSGMRSMCASAHRACWEGGNGWASKPEAGPKGLCLLYQGQGRGTALELKSLFLSCTGE